MKQRVSTETIIRHLDEYTSGDPSLMDDALLDLLSARARIAELEAVLRNLYEAMRDRRLTENPCPEDADCGLCDAIREAKRVLKGEE
jgi:hypothetical protein